MPAIRVDNLVKCFEKTRAVDGLAFSVEEGELFGLLGPNGAGKTTTINILSTLLYPTSGTALVAGFSVGGQRSEVRRSIGIVFQDPALDNKLTARENLQFHAMMYGIPRAERNRRIEELMRLVDLYEKADMLAEKYSAGMKRRLEIARGFLHMPRVLFLDEPTLGLDAQARRHIWDYIQKLNREKGLTIILTTHYMEEADYLCGRVAIMDKGRIVALDTPASLKNLLGGDAVDLELGGECRAVADELGKRPWIKTLKSHDCLLSLTMERGDTRIPELVAIAQGAGARVLSVNLHKPSLEDVFLYFTGKTIREGDGDSMSGADAGRRKWRRGRVRR